MKGLFKKCLTVGLAATLCLSIVPVSALAAGQSGDISDMTVIATDVSEASTDAVLLGVRGKYITDAENALQRINEIRKEACEEGVKNPSTGEVLTSADYVPIRWSGDLEYIARIRAAESSQTVAHLRTNGASCFSITSPNGVSSYGEVLAWNRSESMLDGIDQWYEEKSDWVNNTAGAVTGHYTAMIDPNNRYVGLGTFCSEYAKYYNTTAGEFSSVANLSETPMDQSGDCIQTIEVKNSYLYGTATIEGEMSGIAGESSTHCLTAGVSYPKGAAVSGLYYLGTVSWSSGNEDVATVDPDGLVSAAACGSTLIRAASVDGSLAAEGEYTVNHVEETLPAVAPTCTEPGLKEGTRCNVCGEVNQEVIPATGHDWNSEYTVDVEPSCTREGAESIYCSVCGELKEGSTRAIAVTEHIYGDWTVITAATYTETGSKERVCQFCGNIEEAEIPMLIRTPIAEASVSNIVDRPYTGQEVTQEPVIQIGSTVLENGKDYTISYSPNIESGTVTMTIIGEGDYTGTITKTFEITKADQSITAKAAVSSIVAGKTTTISVSGAQGATSFVSSDTSVATVTNAGKVTAKKVGTVKITVTSAEADNYNKAVKTVTIKVLPAATSSVSIANQATGIKVTWKKVAGATGYYVYRNGTQIKKITNGNTVTCSDTKANANGTKYTYKVVAYAGTGTSTLSKSVVTYRVARPAISSVSNTAAKKMTVKWGKNTKGNGYQIQYNTNKTFASGNKTAAVTKNGTVSKVFSSLTKGKTYYVRVRTFKTVSGKKYYSAWSPVKSVKISK